MGKLGRRFMRWIGFSYPYPWLAPQGRLKALIDAAGLQVRSRKKGVRAEGMFRGRQCRVTEFTQIISWVAIELEGIAFPSGLSIDLEPAGVDGNDPDTGEPAFDDRVRLQVEREEELLAVMDRKTREVLLDLLERGGRVRSGWVSATVPLGSASLRLVEDMREFVDRLELKRGDIPRRLSARCRGDEPVLTRLRAFELLLRRFPATPTARRTAAVLLNDRGGLRLLAATFRKEKDAVAAAFGEKDGDGSLEKALSVLGKADFPTNEPWLLEVLTMGLEASDRAAATRAAEMLAERGCAPAGEKVMALGRALRKSGDEDALERVTRAVGRLGGPGAETFLLEMLKADSSGCVSAAIEGLGAVGGADAVEALFPVSHGLFGGRASRAAEKAIAKIQSRMGPAERGALALTEVDGAHGAVSLGAEGGEVSEGEGGGEGPGRGE